MSLDIVLRCGSVAIIGRPNVGKSTLLNALVGQKISITSRKAQTTRHRITGIRNRKSTQFIWLDTPGFQTQYAAALNRSLNRTVLGSLADVDMVLCVLEAGRFFSEDEKIFSLLPDDIPVVLVANKLDLVYRRQDILTWLQEMQNRFNFHAIFPMSAKQSKDIERLLDVCEPLLPEQEWIYAEDDLTDRSEKFLAGEIIREKLFRLTGDELPYTSTVLIDQFQEEGKLKRIAATIVVEKEAHKGMIIGQQGAKLKRIGSEARVEMEVLFQSKVFLELWVKVRSGWSDDEARVQSYGYE